jgi:phosphate acetyltransferase
MGAVVARETGIRTARRISHCFVTDGHALGFPEVRVAIMSAMETVNPAVPSIIEAAAQCKMAERGQITGGILDGPLALDNAINEEAAAIKHIVFPVAGRANVLVVPGTPEHSRPFDRLCATASAGGAGHRLPPAMAF